MNKQERQALIAHAKKNVAALKAASQCKHFDIYRGELETDLKLAEIALATLTAEPIYQLIDDGNWYDAQKHVYHEAVTRDDKCRIVYTAPPAPVDLAALVPDAVETDDEYDDFAYGANWMRAEILRRIAAIDTAQKPEAANG